MTSCNMYNRTKIIEKKSLIPDKIKVGLHFANFYNKKLFIRRYIDLLADGLHSKLEITAYIHEADIGIWDINIRKSFVSYSSSVNNILTLFAIRAARPLDKAFILVKPFDVMIWICIPFSFLIILLTSYGIMKKETEYRNKEMPKFSTLFSIILRNFLRQDTDVDRYFLITFHILIGCWILIAFILTSAYVGTLPSFMVNPGTETIPHTFQELANSVKKGRYNITYFQNSHEDVYFLRLYLDTNFKKMIKSDVIETFYENVQECNDPYEEPIKKVLNGTHAVLASRQKIELSMTKQQKEEVFISEDILFTNFQFIKMNLVKVNYAEEISEIVNRIAQSGLSEKIDRHIVDEKTREDFFYDDKTIDTNNEEPLKLDDITGLLYLLITGYLIASVVFIIEILVNKIRKITSRKGRAFCQIHGNYQRGRCRVHPETAVYQADIAIYSHNIKETYLSYSSSISHIPTTFAIRAATPLDKAFILIWICIPVSFLIILLTSYGIMKKENKYRNKKMPKFSILFWIILRNFLPQDTDVDRYFLITFRILIGCWILITFVLTSAYVGTLPSFMLNPGTETIPHTFQELAQSVKKGRYNITYFMYSPEQSYFNRLNFDKVIRIQQNGLSEKIGRDILDEKRRNDFYDDKTMIINSNAEEPLKMDDITGLLYLSLTGYMIASVVFVTEILVNKIKMIRSRKCRVRPFNIVN
ncbi:uncharacterized protein LOC111639170 [Centruroides sculpturatus]|uniref:uncharacterized protein LOC111639170 n=1 Tax=Centruroides sculpturatus TaxID=218467 RepID=UPI000C6DC689|nr:uncharacterized protein LOC111639170 [Centruroides sculpturatus]